MTSNDLVAPSLESMNKTFSISLNYKYVYTKQEQLWLDNFKGIDLSREQKTVVRLGVNGRLVSAKEIFDIVGIVDEKAYRELIELMRNIGILETTLSSNEVTNQKHKYGGMRKAVPKYTIRLPYEKASDAQTQNEDGSDYARIYVGNIPFEIEETEIYNALIKFGEVVDVIIPRWAETNFSKGYCFVEFDKRLYANNALNSSDPIIVRRRKLYLREADKKI